MILAIAGHVDHGKTALVRALTGIDTDRIPEEKRRGMSIEPGYAHANLGGASPISFVDLPGHEGFLRQAIAGLTAVDAAVLVVACDDGPMPQTLDCLALMQLLGIRLAAIVLNKADCVGFDRAADVAQAVAALLHGTAFAAAPVHLVSAASGQGIEALRDGLVQFQRNLPARLANGAFRMAVDRAFTRPGAGVVATGTVLSGHVRTRDVLQLSPSGEALRVRGLQVNGQAAESASAGQRCALALVGIELSGLGRGSWLLAPALHAPTQRIDVQLRLLGTAPRPIHGHADVQLHIGAMALQARIVPLHPPRLAPGEVGFAQLILPSAVSALHGDRFVLRDTAAHALVGGGMVLDGEAPARGRASDSRIAELQVLVTECCASALTQLTRLRPDGVDEAAFARQWNMDDDAMQRLCANGGAWQVLPTRVGRRLVSREHWLALQQRIPQTLDRWHVEQPASLGMTEPAVLKALQTARGRPGETAVRQAAIHATLAQGSIERAGFVLRRPGHQAELAPSDAELLYRVNRLMQPMGLRPQPLGELATLLDLPLREAAAALQRMASLGHIVQVAKNRFFLPQTVQALMQIARETAAAPPGKGFDAASFRDRANVGRNLSIQLLEYFDRVGFTRYNAERRQIVADRF